MDITYIFGLVSVMINKFLADKELERKTKEIAVQNKGKDIVILDKFYPTNPFKKFGMILPLCFPLLISSVRKIESTATAAELRGFYLRTRACCTKSYKVHFRDIVFLLLGAAVLAGGIIL